MSNLERTCRVCSKPDASAERLGSLTSFLFTDMHCQCGVKQAGSASKLKVDNVSCKRCGKVVSQGKRAGSLTAFLLREMRCQCAKPLLDEGKDATGGKRAGAGLSTRYSPPVALKTMRQKAHMTAMRTRHSRLQAQDAGLIALEPGEVIDGYELLELIGEGGMGLIYRARHKSLGRVCALKFLAPSMVSQQSWQLFQKEAKIASSLNHPTICQIYDLGIHAGSLPFYAMDYLPGQTLQEVITDNGPLSVGATLELFIKITEGLSYAHRRQVVHRDIKPANIMLVPDDKGSVEIKILDFGISELGDARARSQQAGRAGQGGRQASPSETPETDIIGSGGYMSPEQFAGRAVDLRSDVYSLGCSIFETLTGTLPFEGESLEDLEDQHTTREVPKLKERTGVEYPGEMDAIVRKCMEKNPDQRYQNANELAIDLQRMLDNKPLQFARDYKSTNQSDRQETVAAETVSATRIVAVSGLAVIGLMVAVAVLVYAGVDYSARKGQEKMAEKRHRSSATDLDVAANSWNVASKDAPQGSKQEQEKIFSSFRPQTELRAANDRDRDFDKDSENWETRMSKDDSSEQTFGSVGLVIESFTPTTAKDPIDFTFDSKVKKFHIDDNRDANGVVWRNFSFDTAYSLGVLEVESLAANNSKQHQLRECTGLVTVPLRSQLTYIPSPHLLNPEFALAKFQPGDLYQLNLTTINKNPDKVVKVIPKLTDLASLKLSRFQKCPPLPGVLQSLQKLNTLTLDNFNDPFNHNDMALPDMPKLYRLRLKSSRAGLASYVPDPQNLRVVCLDLFEHRFNSDDADYVVRMPALQRMELNQCKINSVILKKLSACRNLTWLKFVDNGLNLSPADIEVLDQICSQNPLQSLKLDLPLTPPDVLTRLEDTLKKRHPGMVILCKDKTESAVELAR